MFTLPDLPYPVSALEPYIDTQTMQIHHDKHHATYVQNLNNVLDSLTTNPDPNQNYQSLLNLSLEEILQNITKFPPKLQDKIRNNAGGHYNHSLFWQYMAPASNSTPKGKLADLITSVCGDLEVFKKNLTEVAMNRFGSGWAWVIVGDDGLTFTSTANQDSPLTEGKTPILGIDLWEHAYYLKYQNRRAEYIAAWWNVVNWSQVEKNLNLVS